MFDWETYTLVGINVLLYSALAYQRLGTKLTGQVRARSVTEAFMVLGGELREAIPGIPTGFTWREAMRQAMGLGLAVDWSKLGEEVDAYEAYRYGGGSQPPAEYAEVLTLARELRRAR